LATSCGALLAALRRGALPHALLLTGEAGLASAARAVAGGRPLVRGRASAPPTRRSRRLVATGNHPDLHVPRNPPHEQDLTSWAAATRSPGPGAPRLIPALGVRPPRGAGAPSSSTAPTSSTRPRRTLLKTLEEPPRGTPLLLPRTPTRC
jgi:hypothetical protein